MLKDRRLIIRIGIEVLFEALGWIVDIITGIAELSIFKHKKWRAALITIILVVPAILFLWFLLAKT
jgi:hypothetical protein